MYAGYEDYRALYGEGVTEAEFERLAWEAGRIMDAVTTGADGVRKLETAMPEDAYGIKAVKRCCCALVRRLWTAEQEMNYVNREDGTVTGRVITGITAGAESVTYARPGGTAAGEGRGAMLRRTAEELLAGIGDKNGVPLLYMGVYPGCIAEGA